METTVEMGRDNAVIQVLEARARLALKKIGLNVSQIEALLADKPTRMRVYVPQRSRNGAGHREIRLSCCDREVNLRLHSELGIGTPDGREVMWTKNVGRAAVTSGRSPAHRRPVAA